MECILASFITIVLPVLEKFIFRRDLRMMLKVVGHLAKIVRQAFKVNRSRGGGPAEVIVRLLIVGHFDPEE